MVKPPRAHNRRRVVIAGVTVVVLVGGAGAAWAETRSSGPQWRLATAEQASVTDTLVSTGVLAPADDTELNFEVAGTVRKILVREGEHVRAGELLGELKPGTLRAAVSTAEKTLTQAREQLSSDESSESSSTSSTSASSADTTSSASSADSSIGALAVTAKPKPIATATATPTPTGGSGGHGSGGAPTGSKGSSADKALVAAQQAVVQAQHLTDGDLATAKADLASEEALCSSSTSSGTTTDPCETAAATELTDEQTVSTDEAAVLTAENKLAGVISAAQKALAAAAKSAASTTSQKIPTTTSTGAAQTATGATHSSTSRSTGDTDEATHGTTVTAATLARDEANIDSAEATVTSAKADLSEARLRSSVSGTVKLVSVTRGSSVSGTAGTTPEIEVTASKQDTATLYLSATQVRQLTVGMAATVVPDGDTRAVAATITQIGAVEATSASDTTGYPVTVTLAATKESLVSGGDAAVTISLGTVKNVLSVPTSAVHRSGSTFYVLMVNGDTSKRVTIREGASGAVRTQILSGLTAGQSVILANLNEAVPSSNEATTFNGGGAGRTFSFGSGGFSGTRGGPPGAGG